MITAALTLDLPNKAMQKFIDDKAFVLCENFMHEKQSSKVIELFAAEIPQVKAVQESCDF